MSSNNSTNDKKFNIRIDVVYNAFSDQNITTPTDLFITHD